MINYNTGFSYYSYLRRFGRQ